MNKLGQITNTPQNRYTILIKLKEMYNELLKCTNFTDVDLCRVQLLAYIEENSLLKDICQSIDQQLTTNQPSVGIINRIHSYIITLENTHAHFRKIQIIRNKVYKFKDLEQVDIITTPGSSNNYIENPNMCFYPSISYFLDNNNDYLQQMKNKPQVEGLSDLYNLFDDTIGLLFTNLSVQYAFEYILIRKIEYIIPAPLNNNFNAAYLYCIVCAVNKLLQHKVENYKMLEALPINKTLGVEPLSHEKLKELNEGINDKSNLLTPREREVYSLIEKTKPAIAEKLIIDKTTVQTHIENISKKLNVNGKKQIVEFKKKS